MVLQKEEIITQNIRIITQKSKGDRFENLSPKEYFNMIRPYLRDLINNHKPIDDDDTDRAEQKIQLSMQNSCISPRNFEENRTIYSKSEPVEVFMGSDPEDVIGK